MDGNVPVFMLTCRDCDLERRRGSISRVDEANQCCNPTEQSSIRDSISWTLLLQGSPDPNKKPFKGKPITVFSTNSIRAGFDARVGVINLAIFRAGAVKGEYSQKTP